MNNLTRSIITRGAPFFLIAASISGCSNFGPETQGVVSVGRPQVFSRERLLNDRLAEVTWLRSQLQREFDHSLQGIRDNRQFSSLLISLSVDLDFQKKRAAALSAARDSANASRDSAVEAREAELADIRHQIAKTGLQQQLDKLKADAASRPSDAPVPSDFKTDLDKINSSLAAIAKRLDALEVKPAAPSKPSDTSALNARRGSTLADPASAVRTSIGVSTYEKVEDESAFRDMVYAKIRDKTLDDTHDLKGFSLYDLKFDVQITPGANTTRNLIVELEIQRNVKIDPAHYVNESLRDRLKARIQDDANALAKRIQRRLLDVRLSSAWQQRVYAHLSDPKAIDIFASCASRATTSTRSEALGSEHSKLTSQFARANRALFGNVGPTPKDALKLDRKDAASVATSFVALQMQRALEPLYCVQVTAATGGTDDEPNVEVHERATQECFPKDVSGQRVKQSCDFKDKLVEKLVHIENEQTPWVASVEPKEYAQNISDVAASGSIREVLVGLGASAPGQSLGASIGSFKEEQQLLQAIKRQPLASSFSRGGGRFGWVLGGPYEIRNAKAVFVHRPARYTFSASAVVPGWYSSVVMMGCAYWVEPDGRRSTEPGLPVFGNTCGDTVLVNLPSAHRAIMHALMGAQQEIFFDPEIITLPQRDQDRAVILQASPDNCQRDSDIPSCEQQLVIQGRELWRNPEVFIGSQKAHRVELLPSLRGIVATFRGLRSPPRAPFSSIEAQDLLVVTSTGQDEFKKAIMVVAAESISSTPFVSLKTQVVEKSGTTPLKLEFSYPQGSLPKAYTEVIARVREVGSKAWLTLDGRPLISNGLIEANITDLSKSGLADQAKELEVDIAFKFTPDTDWVSMSLPDQRQAIYLPSSTLRQVTYRGAPKFDFKEVTTLGAKERELLRAGLAVALPKDSSLFYKAYRGFERALAGREGRVEIGFANSDDDSPMWLALEKSQSATGVLMRPTPGAIAETAELLVPEAGQAEVKYRVYLRYRSALQGAGWTNVEFGSLPEVTLTALKAKPTKPAADKPKAKDGSE